MVENIKVNGLIIKCMAKEFIHGVMAVNTKGNISMIKSMEKEYFIGLMEVNLKEIGKMESKMELAFIQTTELLKKEFGKKEILLNGFNYIKLKII